LWLGFDYASIDIDGSPGSIPLDLNYDDVPPEAKGGYDLVTNFGTTEHVANQLNAFKIIHDLTAPGGIMIHHVPTQGMFNHGLVNYNFKFFWMLARSNGYNVAEAQFFGGNVQYFLPDNIVDFLALTHPVSAKMAGGFTAADAGIQIVLRKSFEIPFVAPIDVPTGTHTDDARLRRRYWTVFEPDSFAKLRPNTEPTHKPRWRARWAISRRSW
jgi:hypothetical protein